MYQVKKILYKLRIKLWVLANAVTYHILKSNKQKINIVSSPKYKNKIKEDIMLQKYLLQEKIPCKIISWEDSNDASYCIIRSVWGYHKQLAAFKKFLEKNQTINSKNMILDNIDKEKQYHLLQKNHIPVIETQFIEDITQLKKTKEKQVLKPVISASGNDTCIIDENTDLTNYTCKNLMVQPYLEDIQEGELSLIIIHQEIQYGILRFPGVFTKYQKERYIPIAELSQEILSLGNKIKDIEEYKEAVFMRIDFVKDKVLEVELTDPDLFIESIPDKKLKETIYKTFVEAILKK